MLQAFKRGSQSVSGKINGGYLGIFFGLYVDRHDELKSADPFEWRNGRTFSSFLVAFAGNSPPLYIGSGRESQNSRARFCKSSLGSR